MFKNEEFEDALKSETQAEKLGERLASRIESWLEDGVFDDSEFNEAITLEGQLRSVCESAYVEAQGNLDEAVKACPGFASLGTAWLAIGGWVLAVGIPHETLELGDDVRPIAQSELFCILFEVVGLSKMGPLENFVFPWVIAAIIRDTSNPLNTHWVNAITELKPSQPTYANSVMDKLKSLESGHGSPNQKTMSDFLEERKNHKDRAYRKSYKQYQSKLSSEFRDQGFLTFLGGFTDEANKEIMLTVGDASLAISFEKQNPIEIPRSKVSYISVGSRLERMHAGYSHQDFDFWTFDVVSTSGARWRLKKVIGSGNSDSNQMREFLTSWLDKIASHYKVIASGNHEVNESGYRTTMSYGMWF